MHTVSVMPEQHFYYAPHTDLGMLFEAVQLARIFPDSKTFVDCRPKVSPESICAEYEAQHQIPGFNLRTFVQTYFHEPQAIDDSFAPEMHLSMEDHILNHWSYLTRPGDEHLECSSLIPLPKSYVVPGGRFREIYYWDSYFTLFGLASSKRLKLIGSMLDNMAFLINSFGFVPNGNRTYYLSRSQPPFFAAMLCMVQQMKGTQRVLRYLPALEREYQFWMDGAELLSEANPSYRRVALMPDSSLLNRYYDDAPFPRPESYYEDFHLAEGLSSDEAAELYRNIRAGAESGWDYSSRWFGDYKNLRTIKTTRIIPVDLNCLLYHTEEVLSELHCAAGHMGESDAYEKRAARRAQAIHRHLWSPEKKFYYDYDLDKEAQSEVKSLAAVYPLYFDLADQDQAHAVAKSLKKEFLMPGGLVTTLNHSGEQWDSPNGWAPLQFMAIKGLKKYGFNKLADEVGSRWLGNNRKVFLDSAKMMEKYNVVDLELFGGGGEYPLQDGFGWTNGVAIAIIHGD